MSLQMFMKLEGIEGDSTNYQHKGWCDIMSWNWGMTSNRRSAELSADDKTSLNEISVIKPIGSDSPALRLLFAKGAKIPVVEFSVTPILAKREAQTKYIYMKLEGVVIKSIVSGGSNEDKLFKEHLTMYFERIRFEFSQNTQISAEGGAGKAAVDYDFKWDVPSNSELK